MKARTGSVRGKRPALRRKLCSALLLALFALSAPAWAQRSDAPQEYSISAGDLANALDQLASQSKVQIIYPAELVRGKYVAAVNGRQGWREALQKLLANTGLTYGLVNDTTVVIRQVEPTAAAPAASTRDQPLQAASDKPMPITTMAEILVRGSKSLNADIRRTIDDPQPYVVFDREEIERSGAINLNDFLHKRLSANASNTAPRNVGNVIGDISEINLRGLGGGQTLILIDGRRAAPAYMGIGSSPGQVNLNGIPLMAVERIEVLPTTASAIYGGSATGGVVNVILRRDYSGGEVAVSYDNSFDTDSSISRIDLSYGFSLGEKTTLLLSGSYSEANFLLKRDRDFRIRAYEHAYRHDPGYLAGAALLGVSTSPNITSVTGMDLTLADGTPLNSPITHAPVGYRGPQYDGGAALIHNAGRLNAEEGHNAQFANGGSVHSGGPRILNLSASIRHQFTDWLDGFLDLSADENNLDDPAGSVVRFSLPAGHAFNPFQQAIYVMVPSDEFNDINRQRNEAQRVSAGLIARLGSDWASSLDFTWYKSTNFVQRGDGATLDLAAAMADGFNPLVDYYNLGGRTLQPYLLSIGAAYGPSSVYSYNPTLRFSGPLWTLPAGPVSASFLLEQQRSEFAARTIQVGPGSPSESFIYLPARSQDVKSAYAELSVPLVGSENARTGARALELQVAVRHDDYDTVTGGLTLAPPGQSPEFLMVENAAAETSGLLGVKYVPLTGLTFRASHGTGFVPPNVLQLSAPTINDDGLLLTPDPRRGNTVNPTTMTLVQGGNPELGPERSRTTAFGIIVEPAKLPGLRISLDYTRLRKIDNITTLSNAMLLEYEDMFPDRIRRGPNLPTDPPGWAGPISYINNTSINAASARYDFLDGQFRYGFDLANGVRIELWGNGTWTLQAEQQTAPGQAPGNLRGITAVGGSVTPLNFRGGYGIDLEKDGWAAGWAVRHYSSYLVADPELASSQRVLGAQGNGGRVPRQLQHDVWGRWRSHGRSQQDGTATAFFSSLEISGGIRNVFNTRPEVDLANPFQFYSYLIDPRLRTYYVQAKYSF